MKTNRLRRQLESVSVQTIAIVLGVIVLFPVIFCCCSAFKSEFQILTASDTLFPTEFTLDNFKTVFRTTPILRYIVNSLYVALVTSAIRIVIASMAGYAFAFMEFPLKNFWFLVLLGTMMIPTDVRLVPNYFIVAELGLINSYWGVMIVYFINAMSVFMFRQYFKTISPEIRDAASVDGCSDLRFYLTILMPISKPVIATAFISSFVSMWNIYTWPLLVTKTNEMRTVQVAITMLTSSESATAYGAVMAGTMIVLLPTAIIFLVFRKWIISGATAGALKG